MHIDPIPVNQHGLYQYGPVVVILYIYIYPFEDPMPVNQHGFYQYGLVVVIHMY